MGQAKKRGTLEQRIAQAEQGNAVILNWLENNKDKEEGGQQLYVAYKTGQLSIDLIRRKVLNLHYKPQA